MIKPLTALMGMTGTPRPRSPMILARFADFKIHGTIGPKMENTVKRIATGQVYAILSKSICMAAKLLYILHHYM